MTKEEIIEKVKKNMKSIDLEHDLDIGIKCWDKEVEEDLDGSMRETYVVRFKTLDTKVKYTIKAS